MNYPIWQLDAAGGGLLIALVATIHVFISHFAVGGGFFLVLAEHKARREHCPGTLAYVQRHTRFFLLLTMVLGSLSGVGIWFTITVLNPAATSVLIRTFVFAWATEWVFFLVEIVSLLVYFYGFDRMAAREHLVVGWIYAAAAILSLFVINGIIGAMLTPGDWPRTGSFWDAFFNPSFWPAFFLRASFACMLAGLFGFLNATAVDDTALRTRLVRFCALWLVGPFLLLAGSSLWYRSALPAGLADQIFARMPEPRPYITAAMFAALCLLAGGLVMGIRMPAKVSRPLAALMLVIGFVTIGSFEFVRESGRRPFIIKDILYSNGIFAADLAAVRGQGILASARWAEHRRVAPEAPVATGKKIFNLVCAACHSVGGPLNDIVKRAHALDRKELEGILRSMGKERPFMPPFPGNEEEARALVDFVLQAR